MTTNPASSPRRILVRGVNWLGDAVMTTPALQRLRERFPDAEINLLTHEKLSELWENHPALNAVITFGSDESLRSIARRVRDSNFEMAIILPNSPRSALEAWLARVPQRVGYTWSWRNWFLTQAIPARAERVKMRKRSIYEIKRLTGHGGEKEHGPSRVTSSSHQIHEYLHLVAAVGANPEPVPPMLEVTPEELRRAEEKILSAIAERRSPQPAGQPTILVGLNPGAEYGPAKRWAAENFAVVVREVSRRHGNCVWVAFGGPNDLKVCQQIERVAGGNILNLAGKTSLRELMASLKLCRLLLTNDSGPMHVAAALGTPVVVPFGSTSPELTGPGLPGDTRHRLLRSSAPCSPCFRRVCPIDFRCMTGISPGRVTNEVLKMIGGAKA